MNSVVLLLLALVWILRKTFRLLCGLCGISLVLSWCLVLVSVLARWAILLVVSVVSLGLLLLLSAWVVLRLWCVVLRLVSVSVIGLSRVHLCERL